MVSSPERSTFNKISGIAMRRVFLFPPVTFNSLYPLSDRTWFSNKFTIVDRILREANIKKWLAKSRPKLKPVHIAKRLAWARAHTSAKIIPCFLCAPCVWHPGGRNANRQSGCNVGSTSRPDFASPSAIRPDAIRTRTPTSCASWLRLVLLYYLRTPPDLQLFRSYCVGSSAIAFWLRRIYDFPAPMPVASQRTSGLHSSSDLAS